MSSVLVGTVPCANMSVIISSGGVRGPGKRPDFLSTAATTMPGGLTKSRIGSPS